MAESLLLADVGWSMSYRRFSPSAGYQLRKPPLSVGCLAQTPYQSHHDHSWRTSTLWDRYICTQGLTIPDPLYKSSTSRKQVKKPRRYVVTLEERHHQELLALMDQPTNGRRLTRGLLGKIMDQDRKS